jgi:hypothetical protein
MSRDLSRKEVSRYFNIPGVSDDGKFKIGSKSFLSDYRPDIQRTCMRVKKIDPGNTQPFKRVHK